MNRFWGAWKGLWGDWWEADGVCKRDWGQATSVVGDQEVSRICTHSVWPIRIGGPIRSTGGLGALFPNPQNPQPPELGATPSQAKLNVPQR